MSLRIPSWPAVAVIGAAAADSVVAATAQPFTWRADITTALGLVGTIACGLVVLLRQRRRAAESPPAGAIALPTAGGAAWAAWAAAIVAFELLNFYTAPRSRHPTISSLLSILTGHEVLRAVLFAAWLGAGYWLWGSA
jgi:hypothetical protein